MTEDGGARPDFDRAQAEQHLQLLFPDELSGLIELRLIVPDAQGARRTFHTSVDSVLHKIEPMVERTINVYVGVATRRSAKDGSKANLADARVLWLDYDGNPAELRCKLGAFSLPPSLIVHSGGGAHAYWLLCEPFALLSEEQITRFEHVLKGLADALGGDQSATDASRVLRIPGTVNYPDKKKSAKGRETAPSRIAEHTDKLYSFDDFEPFELRGQTLSASSTRKAYEHQEWDGDLPKGVEHILPDDRRVRERFDRIPGDHPDQSESGIDASLAMMLARRGLAGSEIEAALRASRAQAGVPDAHKAEDYYRRTVEHALGLGQSKREENAHGEHEPEAEQERAEPLLDPSDYFNNNALIVPTLAGPVRDEGHLRLGVDHLLYRYHGGVYVPDGDAFLRERVRIRLGDKFKKRHVEEVSAWVRSFPATVRAESHPDLLNVVNGLLDWRTGTLTPHTPEHVSLNQLPVEWQPEATCPQIACFLDEVLPKGCNNFVNELVGYALYAGNPYRKAVLLLGPGSNGKSVLLRLVTALLGKANVSSVPLQVLSDNRFASAGLYGKLANICGDLDARAVKQTDMFKMLTGGDPLYAERKNRDPFEFRCYALPLFSANEPPISSDQTHAWFDRWIVVPMERRFEPSMADPKLDEKLTTGPELEGLLVEAVAGLRRLMKRGHFEYPASVREAHTSYRERLDTAQAFVAEECVLEREAWMKRSALYKAYRDWCARSGRQPVSAHSFYEKLRQGYRGKVVAAKRGVEGFTGIGLRIESEQPETGDEG